MGPPNPRLSHRRELRWGRRGSRVLWLTGRRAGRWRDFESGQGGDLLDAVMTTTGCRFPEALRHSGGGTWPALVALVRDPEGRLLGLHRLWLTPDGGKAPVEPVRASLRHVATMAGGCVRFGPVDAELEAGAEGIETALSLRLALPGLAVRAVLGAGGFAHWRPGPAARRVLLCPDRDRAGLRAAQRCSPRLHRAGIEVRLALPPRPGEDFNDLLRRAGPAAVRERLLAALGG